MCLIQARGCDVLSLDLPPIARALVRTGPYSQVRILDPATGRYRACGPADRSEVLATIGSHLLQVEAGVPLWPGVGLLTSVHPW
ncbi:hypothetical protein ACIF80_16925 [Streptomyces sp. NPDC085927]|uniref:hypothetical protein n=1 Tax=Streptomyces sp. NPDC085927 TaxID=3365738 RepID=UPI0037D0665D